METTEKPNVILICVDQWRGDCLGVDGHPVVQTPYLSRLALLGARFSHAYAACPTCIAARASLMTGLIPRTHGRVGYRDGIPWTYPVSDGRRLIAGRPVKAVLIHVGPKPRDAGEGGVSDGSR